MIQLILMPAVLYALTKARLIPVRYPKADCAFFPSKKPTCKQVGFFMYCVTSGLLLYTSSTT